MERVAAALTRAYQTKASRNFQPTHAVYDIGRNEVTLVVYAGADKGYVRDYIVIDAVPWHPERDVIEVAPTPETVEIAIPVARSEDGTAVRVTTRRGVLGSRSLPPLDTPGATVSFCWPLVVRDTVYKTSKLLQIHVAVENGTLSWPSPCL